MRVVRTTGHLTALDSEVARCLDDIRTERGLSPNTVMAYGSDLACFVAWATRRKLKSAADVTRASILEYRRALSLGVEKETKTAGDRAIRSPRSVRRAQATLRAFFRFLRSEG